VRILLDECVPWPLSRHLPGHICSSPHREGWGGFKNGELLTLAESEYNVFVTSDQNLCHQQNLAGRNLAILELSTNDWNAIKTCIEDIGTVLESLQPGDFRSYKITTPGIF